MKDKYLDVGQELAKEHWEYLAKLLRVHGVGEEEIHKIGFHYKTAFIHGWKHCFEFIYDKGGLNENIRIGGSS